MEYLFLKLFLAHLIGDFVLVSSNESPLATTRLWRQKRLYVHGLIHAVLIVFFLGFDVRFWLAMIVVPVTHLFTKATASYLQNRWNWKSHWILFSMQVFHILLLVIVSRGYFPEAPSILIGMERRWPLLLTALVLLTSVSSAIIRSVMQQWTWEDDVPEGSLRDAGKYIGFLERIFVFGFILMQQWQAIGLLIAAKSVFRFGDLSRAKDRKLTEYMLIGTLLSIGLGILVGIAYTILDNGLHLTESDSRM